MPASRCLSLDETIEMGSSIYASDMYQYVRGKRHDWGIMIRKISGSCREVLGLEYYQLSEEDRYFVGAGWCRDAHVEPGKKYYKPKTFEYNGKGYAIFMHLSMSGWFTTEFWARSVFLISGVYVAVVDGRAGLSLMYMQVWGSLYVSRSFCVSLYRFVFVGLSV